MALLQSPSQRACSLATSAPAASSGTGTASLTLIGNQLFWDVNYSGLTSSAVAAHVHGPAPVTEPAGVLFGNVSPSGQFRDGDGQSDLDRQSALLGCKLLWVNQFSGGSARPWPCSSHRASGRALWQRQPQRPVPGRGRPV